MTAARRCSELHRPTRAARFRRFCGCGSAGPRPGCPAARITVWPTTPLFASSRLRPDLAPIDFRPPWRRSTRMNESSADRRPREEHDGGPARCGYGHPRAQHCHSRRTTRDGPLRHFRVDAERRFRRNATKLRLNSVWPLVRRPRTHRSQKINMSGEGRPYIWACGATMVPRWTTSPGATLAARPRGAPLSTMAPALVIKAGRRGRVWRWPGPPSRPCRAHSACAHPCLTRPTEASWLGSSLVRRATWRTRSLSFRAGAFPVSPMA
jgi:hypothetical protein